MSEFSVNVTRIRALEPIEGADRIELAVIGEFRSIVQKGKYMPGDLAVYLPEQAILPEWLIERLGLVGKLSGGQKNRIKAVKMKGCLSQGICLGLSSFIGEPDETPIGGILFGKTDRIGMEATSSVQHEFHSAKIVYEGDDVQEFLGIKKFDPMEAMSHEQRKKMHGECAYIPGKTKKYDFENWKKYPNIFQEGDEVVITEKLHGTMCCFAYYPGLNHPELPDDVFVYSKGLGAGGQVFKWNEANAGNLYLRAFKSLEDTYQAKMCRDANGAVSGPWTPLAGQDFHAAEYFEEARARTVLDRMLRVLEFGYDIYNVPVFIFGEVYGRGVQDLPYDAEEPEFRAFDVWVGEPTNGRFLDTTEKYDILRKAQIPHVPILYQGPFNRDLMLSLTDGKTTLGGGHIREGVVITSAIEEDVHRFGRKILKNVSGDYLTRKGNTTEFA